MLTLVTSLFNLTAQETGKKISLPEKNIKKHTIASRLQPGQQVSATSCGTDTLMYPYLKELLFTATNDSFFVDAMVGNVRTASQAYVNTGTVNVTGIQFWGGAYSTSPAPQTLQVKMLLYTVDAFFSPVAAIDSAFVTVTNTYDFYEANFIAPHVMTTNYAVAVKCVVSDTLAVITNNAGAGWQTPAYGEALAWRRFGSGTWNSSLSFFGQDLEYMIFPIVNYNVNASFTASNDTICAGTAVTFTNTSTGPYTDRMTNLYAFEDYWGLAVSDSSFWWNYGTATTWSAAQNGQYTYMNAGTYTASLAAEIAGYYASCLDTASAAILVNSANVSVSVTSTTITAGASGATYQWLDCNNGNAPIVGETGQSFVAPSNGDYAVIVTQNGCTDTSACTNISSVSIRNQLKAGVTVNPNPASGSITVNSGNAVADIIVVRDMTGRVLRTVKPDAPVSKIDLHELPASVYFVSVMTGSAVQVIRLIKQ